MPDTKSSSPSFVVVLMCPDAHIGDVIEALRTRHVSALETIHLHDLAAPYPERISGYPCLLVFGRGRSELTHDEAALRHALRGQEFNTVSSPSL